MKIRKAKKKDLDNLIQLYTEFLNYMNKFTKFVKNKKIPKINKKELKKALNQRIKSSNKRRFLISEDKDKLLGFIEAEIMSSKESKTNKKIIEVVDIYVKNKRKGVGNKLFKEIEEWSKSEKAKFIQWEFLYGNKVAENFCVKNKFKHFKVKMLKKIK